MVRSKFAMFRYFSVAAVILSVQFSPALADSVDLSRVPADQAEKIRQIVKESTPTPEQIEAEKINQKVDHFKSLGRNLAIAYKATAEEMGMDEKTFSETAFGKFSYFWIAWELWFKDTSNTLASVMLGLFWWLFAYGIWLYAFRRICMFESVKTEKFTRTYADENGRDITEEGTSKSVQMYDINDGDVAGYRFVFALIAIVLSIPGFILIS